MLAGEGTEEHSKSRSSTKHVRAWRVLGENSQPRGGWVGVDIEQQNKPEEKAETGSHRALNAML